MTPLTFERALRWLADNEPEKFRLDDDQDCFHWKFKDVELFQVLPKTCIGSDDLDEILSLIGWEYWHTRWADGFGYFIEETNMPPLTNQTRFRSDKCWRTKLEASKAAFIAAVTHYAEQKEGE